MGFMIHVYITVIPLGDVYEVLVFSFYGVFSHYHLHFFASPFSFTTSFLCISRAYMYIC